MIKKERKSEWDWDVIQRKCEENGMEEMEVEIEIERNTARLGGSV